MTRRFAVAGAAFGLALALSPAVHAQDGAMTVQTLIDRAQIEDLLTRYYYNLGRGSAETMSGFYADDAELVLGANTFKGKAGIESAYARRPPTPAPGAPPPPPNPIASAFSFNVSVSNPLIVVRGDTATAQLIFTEVIIDKQGDPPRLLAQGREYDTLVKVNGQWRFKKRQIVAGTKAPPDWPG